MPKATTATPPMQDTINSANAAASTLFLGHNGEWWDFWLIISLVFAAAAAAAVVIATTGSIVAHKREGVEAELRLENFRLETAKEIADANARAAEANEKAEAERLARIQLEAKISPRRLSPEDAKIIEHELAGLRLKVCIVSYGGSEPTAYSDSLFFVFDKLGFVLVDNSIVHRVTSTLPNGSVGVSVFLPESIKSKAEAENDVLVSALQKAHVNIAGVRWGNRAGLVMTPPNTMVTVSPDEYVISVGEKPLPND
jgi:hypothetical protein